MFIYSTCRDCGGLLHVTDNCTVHPDCTPKPTKAERLRDEWLWAMRDLNRYEANRLQVQIDELDNRPPRLLDAALKYASWGWPVFPLAPVGYTDPRHPKYIANGKKPYPGSHGLKDANTDTERIQAWWQKRPDSNIGLPTGHKFDVFDVDVPKNPGDTPHGPLNYTKLVAAVDPRTGRGPIPDAHGQVATSRGGLHIYIEPTGSGNRTALMPGIDIRGQGGYVVAPPSTLGEAGRSWSWITPPSPVITGAGDTYGR